MGDRKSAKIYTARGPAEGEDWAAVAAALNDRMSSRRIGQQQLAELSGVSVSTVRLLQHGAGRRVQNKTLAAVTSALGWPDELGLREVSRSLRGIEAQLSEICDRLAAVERAVGVRRGEG